jgi:hypothetical protein
MWILNSVSRWYIFLPKDPNFNTYIKEDLWMKNVGIFLFIMTILLPFGIFYGQWKILFQLVIFFPVSVCLTKKNLATSRSHRLTDNTMYVPMNLFIHTYTYKCTYRYIFVNNGGGPQWNSYITLEWIFRWDDFLKDGAIVSKRALALRQSNCHSKPVQRENGQLLHSGTDVMILKIRQKIGVSYYKYC